MQFDVVFDLQKFKQSIGFDPSPRPAFPIDFTNPDDNERVVVEGLQQQIPGVLKPAHAEFQYPYLVPGAIYDQLWDWDAYFMGFGLFNSHPEHYQGCIQNFLDRIRPDGQPAKLVHPSGRVNYDDLPYPIQAQWCVAASAAIGDFTWVNEWWSRLVACRAWYERKCQRRRGLFRQPVSRGAGLDNDPVIYGRRHETVAMVDMNCFHYREYQALASLANQLGKVEEYVAYTQKAEDLKQAVNDYMWDPIDGMFYHLDLSDHVDVTRQEITWEVPYKVRSAATLFVLWAGVADTDKAQRLIEEHVLNPKEFLSTYGIRSLAANERIYNNVAMGDPSNWQGPIWGLVNALVAYGLARYGYKDEALDVAQRLIAVFAGDLRANQTLHEYYDAEIGIPIFNPGFLSWNLMAMRLLRDLRNNQDPTVIPT